MRGSTGIYDLAWHILRVRIATTRRQTISKDELRKWLYDSLEQAIDEQQEKDEG